METHTILKALNIIKENIIATFYSNYVNLKPQLVRIVMDRNIDIKQEMRDGFNTAYIDHHSTSNLAYKPEFLTNNSLLGKKVLVSLEQELANCDEFIISVAFITKSGLTPFLQTLNELEKKGIPGRILTTDYLSFSEPEALEKISGLSNIELRMFRTNDETGGFHTKGYIFRKDEVYRIIIGSSNMTLNAITKNREWNTKIVSTLNGELTRDILREFEQLWSDSNTQKYDEFIEQYRIEYRREKMIREQQNQAIQEKIIDLDRCRLEPNKMQVAFVDNIMNMRSNGVNKALLISATGTGKTYASAFAVREINPKRILFVVHREHIAKQTIRSYMKIFGSSHTYGLISGTSREMNADFIFSTMQMMTKKEIHEKFTKDEFDVIILDECHRSGNDSYQRIMEYFTPKLWLGMTASPDTNQYDIYSIFDHNIAYEIRLQQALEENLLCPFHYFGITDLEINGEVFDDKTGFRNFSNLVSDDRVDYVIEKAEYFGYSGERLKGLIFCSRKEEAHELSKKFNMRRKKDGSFYRTEALTGEDSQSRREEVCTRLIDNNSESPLDYIFTVDIFNEGVDLPEINQVIMLRPTESPVIFIQQLGRGLRKVDEKEYVVVLDFIGNYMNNFMIPIALSGDRSYNKDSMRRYIREGSRVIPGSSTIHFDEISKKRIYASIDTARTSDIKLLRDSYQTLKNKLGRIPTILEFKEYGSIDITKIFDKCGSYYNFLKRYDKENYNITLSAKEESVIEYMSRKLVQYKRVYDLALLKELLDENVSKVCNFAAIINTKYGLQLSSTTEASVINNLTNAFPKDEEIRRVSSCVFIERDDTGAYHLTSEFSNMLKSSVFRTMVEELITFGIEKYQDEFSNVYKDTSFQLYQKYTYEDVARLLGWKRNPNAQNIGGYFYDSETKTLPVFINYEKADDAIAYEDRFIRENLLIALSKHPRKITSPDVAHIYKRGQAEQDNRIFLFVRKNKDDNEAKEFYFLGEIFAEGEPNPIHMEKTNDDAFEIQYRLDIPVRSDIYDYIVRD